MDYVLRCDVSSLVVWLFIVVFARVRNWDRRQDDRAGFLFAMWFSWRPSLL